MKNLISFLVGILFALGLGLSGCTLLLTVLLFRELPLCWIVSSMFLPKKKLIKSLL